MALGVVSEQGRNKCSCIDYTELAIEQPIMN